MHSRCFTNLTCLVCLITIGACSSHSQWSQTNEFLSRLGCGMSEEEVAVVVAEFPGLKLQDSERGTPWDKVAVKGGTTIDLDFRDLGLRQAEVIWVDGILSAESLPVHDFCSP